MLARPEPVYANDRAAIYVGDSRHTLEWIREGTINCCVTSPPYYGLRDYDVQDQIGLEKNPYEYISNLVRVFTEVRRVLTESGVLWVNIGDSYASFRDGKVRQDTTRGECTGTAVKKGMARNRMASTFAGTGIKHKDMIGIPWMLAFALRDSGWYLRQDIIWSKPNPMPESVKDRCTSAHEYIFLFTKKERYYYDAAAVTQGMPVRNRK